jgi:3-deoxy-D-manno-octulosonic-acid transferase
MLRLVYTALLYVFAPLALIATASRGLRDPVYRDRWSERLGFTRARFGSPPIWIHAVSVGEVQAAAALVRGLRKRHPQRSILITTATPTGAQRVQALFGDSVRHAYLPYDLPSAVRRFLNAVKPQIALIMEREIWPNLFRECERRGIPIVLASARLSEQSARRHRQLAALFKPALARNVTIAAQTAADAARFRAIGADGAHVQVTGNIKFDFEIPEEARAAGEALRASQFSNRLVWVAGSTHEKEEDVVLDAHERVLAQRADALLILVPRHPNRFEQVRAALQSRGVKFATRSAGGPVTPASTVLLADTLGELLTFYAATDIAFVGGSLVPIGGHNLLEPAALARPIVVGPHNFNGQDVAEMLLTSGAAVAVTSADSLSKELLKLAASPALRMQMGARGREIVVANRGALGRVLEIIEPLLKQADQLRSRSK